MTRTIDRPNFATANVGQREEVSSLFLSDPTQIPQFSNLQKSSSLKQGFDLPFAKPTLPRSSSRRNSDNFFTTVNIPNESEQDIEGPDNPFKENYNPFEEDQIPLENEKQ